MEQRLILINLLIKLGVAAAVASILVRSVEFKRLLFREDRISQTKNLPGPVGRGAAGDRRVDPAHRAAVFWPVTCRSKPRFCWE